MPFCILKSQVVSQILKDSYGEYNQTQKTILFWFRSSDTE